MIFDAQTRRLVILHRERPVATVSASAPVMINTEGFILGAGPGGALFRAFPPTGLGRAVDQGDSLFLVRVSRSRSGVDTLARRCSVTRRARRWASARCRSSGTRWPSVR
jgi:hypothetical protein